jgi:hypothetical protein
MTVHHEIEIQQDGMLYIGGSFTNWNGNSDYIVHWNDTTWRSIGDDSYVLIDDPRCPDIKNLIYGTNSNVKDDAARCGYCGSSKVDNGNCQNCGAPPWFEREYEHGEFVVQSHEEKESESFWWHILRPKRKLVSYKDKVIR